MFIYNNIELFINGSEEFIGFQAGYAHKSGEFVRHWRLTDKINLFYYMIYHDFAVHANLTKSLDMYTRFWQQHREGEWQNDAHGWRVCPREAIILASCLSTPAFLGIISASEIFVLCIYEKGS